MQADVIKPVCQPADIEGEAVAAFCNTDAFIQNRASCDVSDGYIYGGTRQGYQVDVDLTGSGVGVQFRHDDVVVAEIVHGDQVREALLPVKIRLLQAVIIDFLRGAFINCFIT